MNDQKQDNQTIRTYSDLIKQWFERSEFESDIFTKFIFLYISFIAYLTQVTSGEYDRGTIRNLKGANGTRSFYISLIQNNAELRATIQDLITYLRKRPIRNDTMPNDTNWKVIDGELRGETDWENLVEYWYRVRNNLFHGHKAPDIIRDKELVNYAYLTLTPLMEHFIENDLPLTFD
jgi:hypothetical protein